MDIQPRGKFRYLMFTAFGGLSFLLTFNKSFLSWMNGWFQWCPTSIQLLEAAEQKLLSYVKKPYEVLDVPIAFGETTEECKIRSLFVNKNEDRATPLVLLHGFASGIGLWVLNIDKLSQNRPLYALDLLGFGLSSRPVFSKDAETAENQLVESIEQWRKEVGLSHFILLGHSMGGFLAASYALKYPERIKHLILADPWGFPTSEIGVRKIEIPLWVKAIARILKPFNPLAGVRIAGPWGPKLVKSLRPDIMRKFKSVVSDPSDVSNYIYHCNAQTPSGEAAFKSMTAEYGWANRPMIQRISTLDSNVPITFIYGSRSWIDSGSGAQTKTLCEKSYVEIKTLQGAGHHVYADKAEEFNDLVCNICNKAEDEKLLISHKNNQIINQASASFNGNEDITIVESM